MTDIDDTSATTTSQITSNSPNVNDKKAKAVQCILDPNLVNAETLPLMKDIALSIFASACSKNRGAFVLDPPDGHTYGCLSLPPNVMEMVGIDVIGNDDDADDAGADGKERALKEEVEEEPVPTTTNSTTNATSSSDVHPPLFTVTKVEDIMTHYKDGNLTSNDVVRLLDFVVTNVYHSTPNVEANPYACDTNGLVTLQCDANADVADKPPSPIRAVTMAGVFTPALWATGGKELTLEQATGFYTAQDYQEMLKLGLNTVQIPIPIPTKMFSSQEHQDEHNKQWKNLLINTLDTIQASGGLDVILVLVDPTNNSGPSEEEDIARSVKEAVLFANNYSPLIIAMTLPSTDDAVLEAAATAANNTNIKIWIPINGGDFKSLSNFFEKGDGIITGASLELSHTTTIADKASSTSQEDRAKLFYHESIACIARAPLEYSTCYQADGNMPVFVSQGFDLAIDDCHLRGLPGSTLFEDYGQCNRFNETIHSPWWKEHRFSFASRQLFAYEKGSGWSFASWKLYNDNDDDKKEELVGVLDTPAKLLAFREVVAAGIMPSLLDLDHQPMTTFPVDNNSSPVVGLACMNPPVNDFVLGDSTLAPTPAPPPDCGNGWWNFTTDKCDYWIPPTAAPCPVCSSTNDTATTVVINPTELTDFPKLLLPARSFDESGISSGDNAVAIKAFFSGAFVSAFVCLVTLKLFGSGGRRAGYEPVANVNGHQNGINGNHYQNSSANGNHNANNKV